MLLCFLCALSSSLDSFTVSVSYGIRNIKLPYKSILAVCIISTIGTFLPMKFGQIIISYTGENIINYIGSIILIIIGAFFIYETVVAKDDIIKDVLNNPTTIDIDKSGTIDINEALILAIALTVNNIAVGVASSVAGLSIIHTTLFTFIVTFVSIQLGYSLGKHKLANSFGNYSQITSGFIMILIGFIKIVIG